MLELELDAVFARSWQLCGPAGALSQPGDHALAQAGRVPLLLVRGADGVLRALHNVCRHRAGPIALCDGRGARALHCRYHGWTYALDGQLRSAPEMQGAADFDVGAIRLPQAQCAQWQGLVFAALDGAAPPFDEVFGGIAEQAGATFGAPLSFARRVSYEIACNWKVYVDNYLEGYHLPHVHPGLNRLLDYRSYETVCAKWSSLQLAPVRGVAGAGQAPAAGSAPDTAAASASAPGGGYYAEGGAYYWFVYPNIMLNCLPGRLQTNRVVPLAVDRCRVDFDYYYPAGGDAEAAARYAQDQDFSDEVQAEDGAICEAVQRNLASGSYEAGRLCPRRESGVHHFHQLLRAAYADLQE